MRFIASACLLYYAIVCARPLSKFVVRGPAKKPITLLTFTKTLSISEERLCTIPNRQADVRHTIAVLAEMIRSTMANQCVNSRESLGIL